jgi:trk system potassium uptake protein TrkH
VPWQLPLSQAEEAHQNRIQEVEWQLEALAEEVEGSVGVRPMVVVAHQTAAVVENTIAEQSAQHLTYMFEAVSAFNTVGLSMGATGELSTPGRLCTVVLMFIGRVGTLTFVAAMAREPKRIKGGFRYAYEDVSIG